MDDLALTFVLSSRQLWVEHLELFSSEITEILQTLLPSGTLPLQQALRRLCAQLVDLSPALAMSVADHVIKATISEIGKHLEQPEGSEVTEGEEEMVTDSKKLAR